MYQIDEDFALLQELLGVTFPQAYKDVLVSQCKGTTKGPVIPGLTISLDEESAWGATEMVRASRPDLGRHYLTVGFFGTKSVCMNLSKGDEHDAPVVMIELDSQRDPVEVSGSLREYIARGGIGRIAESLVLTQDGENDEWFEYGLKRLDWHMNNVPFKYDHKDGGRLPRSHLWRPYRFCVQDVILGITVIRHDRLHNSLEVDVFLTAKIPEYEPDSGCMALALIILSDAYRSGGSMEIRFTRHVEGGRVPCELCDLSAKLKVGLAHVDKGGITPYEAKGLYLALSGFKERVIKKVSALEEIGKLSAASVCYAMHHGVWEREELEVIMSLSASPETVLTGSYPSELWHLYSHDLRIGRTALMGSYLDRQLKVRLHQLEIDREEGGREKITELEDDERSVDIDFVPEYCAKRYCLGPEEDQIPVPWVENGKEPFMLDREKRLFVILSSRDAEELREKFDLDFNMAMKLQESHPGDLVCVMVPADFRRLDMEERSKFAGKAEESKIGIIICPEYVNRMDRIVGERFESVKAMRN